MNDFINVIENDHQIRIKLNNMLDRYNRLPFNYKSKIRYDNLIQNINLKDLINIMGTIITDIDIEIKMKISKI